MIKVDLPEPLTPVTAVMSPMGISTVTERRLWARARTTLRFCLEGRLRCDGNGEASCA